MQDCTSGLPLQLCSCGTNEVDPAEHVLFSCHFYQEACFNTISPLLKNFSGCSDADILKKLLMRVNRQITTSCANFFSAAC